MIRMLNSNYFQKPCIGSAPITEKWPSLPVRYLLIKRFMRFSIWVQQKYYSSLHFSIQPKLSSTTINCGHNVKTSMQSPIKIKIDIPKKDCLQPNTSPKRHKVSELEMIQWIMIIIEIKNSHRAQQFGHFLHSQSAVYLKSSDFRQCWQWIVAAQMLQPP